MEIPRTIYGYQITVPEIDSLDFIDDMISINDTLVEPIQIYCITYSPSDNDVQIILGFIPENDLSRIMFHVDALREFIMDNPMFDSIHMTEKPAFYAGWIWKNEVEREAESEAESKAESDEESEESDEESEAESDEESDEESEVESEEESKDNDSSDSDKTDDETDDKSISYYVSKYYI